MELIILNKTGDSGILCLFPDCKGNTSDISLFKMMLEEYLFKKTRPLYQVQEISFNLG